MIIVGPGTFTENSGVKLPSGVSLVGAGIDVTIIESTLDSSATHNCVLNPGNNSVVANLTVQGDHSGTGVYSKPFGSQSNDNAFTGVKVFNCKFTSDSDGIDILKAGIGTLDVYDSMMVSKFDTCNFESSGGVIRLFNCQFIAVGPFASGIDAEPCTGPQCYNGTVIVHGGSIDITAGDTYNLGANSEGAGAILELHNVRMVRGTGGSAPANNRDLRQISSGVLKINDLVRYDGAELVTLGTITNLFASISGFSGYSGAGLSGYSGYSGSGGSGYSGFSGLAGAAQQTTVAGPKTTTSVTAVMCGLAGAITPSAGGSILVALSGQAAGSSSTALVTGQIRYGTGAAPTLGASTTGTALGVACQLNTGTALSNFFLTGAVTGLSPGTAYWVDIQFLTAARTGSVSNVCIAVVEG